MSETTYSYTISTDFPGGKVNTSNLKEEIQQSSVITISLNRIDTSGDTLDIVFNNSLPSGDKTVLDGDVTGPAGGLIALHDSTVKELPRNVVINDSIGGRQACFDGHVVSAAQNEIKHSDMLIKEALYLQGAHITWKGCFLGDRAQMSLINPYSLTAPQSALSQDDTVITVGTGLGMFYDPTNITYGSPYAEMEFYDNTGQFKFAIKVASVSGDDVTLASGVPVAVATDWSIRCSVSQFHLDSTGFYLLGDNVFQYFQNNSYTTLIPANFKFTVRLIANNTDAGTRQIAMNYIFRKYV